MIIFYYENEKCIINKPVHEGEILIGVGRSYDSDDNIISHELLNKNPDLKIEKTDARMQNLEQKNWIQVPIIPFSLEFAIFDKTDDNADRLKIEGEFLILKGKNQYQNIIQNSTALISTKIGTLASQYFNNWRLKEDY